MPLVTAKDVSELSKHLTEVLQSWPLYKRFEYGDADPHKITSSGRDFVRFALLPQQLELYLPDLQEGPVL